MDPEQTFLRVHARLSGMLSQLLTPRIRLVLEYLYLTVAVALFCLLVVMHTNFVQQPGCSSELSGIEFNEAQLVQIKITSGGLWAQTEAEKNMVNIQKQESLIESSKTPEINGDGFTILSTKFWSNWIGSGARRSKIIFKSWKGDKEFLEPQVEKAADTTISKTLLDGPASKVEIEELQEAPPMFSRESFKSALAHFCSKWSIYISSFWTKPEQVSSSGSQIWKTAGWNALLDIPKVSKMLRVEHLNSFLVA